MASILGIALPIEVWEIIFSYLKTSDVINFTKCSDEYTVFLNTKEIIKNFDVSFNYDFVDENLCDYIKENVSFEYINTLNINKLYWINLECLRNLLKKLTNLEHLLALNTQLSLRQKDIVLYSRLKTLAISVEGTHLLDPIDPIIYKNNLYLLRKFCLHITRKHPSFFIGMHRLFAELFALEELWIYDSDNGYPHPIKYDTIVAQLKFLNKLVIKSRVNIPFLDYKPFGLAKYFETRRFKSIAMQYERLNVDGIVPFKDVSIFEPFETELEQAWDVFRKYRSEMPYDPNIHKEVYLTRKIKKVKFKELNFFHNKCFCTNDFIRATKDFLRSENSKDLLKLSIKTCVLQSEPLIKTNRLSVARRQYSFKDIVENCSKLTSLELMQCSSCNVTIIDAYPLISQWKHLETLTLEIPSHLRGDFFLDLIKSCDKLKFLRIISYNTNEPLNRNLYKALPYASNIKDFSFECKSLNISEMFHSLCQITTRKLRRIFINCDFTNSTEMDSLETFLDANPQIMLMFFAISQQSKSYLKNLQDCMNHYKRNNNAKQFFAKKDACNFIKNYIVCDANEELFNNDTTIATVDMYNFK